MRNSLWLALLIVSISCTANDTLPSASPEYLRCPSSMDNGANSSDSSIFGSSADNPYNCLKNPSICGSLGANFKCEPTLGCCKEAILGHCSQISDCPESNQAICDLTTNNCVQCSASNTALGDTQCQGWAATQVNSMAKTRCLSGTCVECKNSNDCSKNATKPICDVTDNTCKGCTKNNDCPGSQLCKLDMSMLAAGESILNFGECVKATDVALVDNLPANCSDTGAGGKPYCQITEALGAVPAKPYISVKGNGGTTANLYQTVNVSGSRQVVIYGPAGRDAPFATQQAVINGVMATGGAQVSLIGLSVTNNMNQPAVQCNTASTIYIQNVLISDTIIPPKGGVYANSCSKVDVERTKITGANGYGVFINGGSGHRVVNNAFINGGSSGERSGLKLSSAAGLFAFNTIANNSQGVQCDTAATITDSIVTANFVSQIAGSCQQTRVVVDQVELDSSYTNTPAGDPKLTTNPLNDACCVDKGMPDSPLTIKDDYQSLKRPIGKGYDIGAFEVR